MKTYRTATIGLALALIIGAWHGTLGAGYKMKIEFPGYTNRTDTLTNFPVLVVLSNNVEGSGFDYDTFMSEDGYDLRFRNADDTTDLNYEIELWDTNGASYVWVQVDELPTNGTGSILARWGVDDMQQAYTTNGATWTNGYLGVWHMKETSLDPADSALVPNDNSGTNNGFDPSVVNAMVGKGYDFNGNGRIDMLNGGDFSGLPKLTITLWYYKRGQGGGGYGSLLADREGYSWGFRHHETDSLDPRLDGNFYDACGTLGNSAWHHLAYVFNDADDSLDGYHNGASVNQTSPTESWYAIDQLVGIAENDERAPDGILDEIRIADKERSGDWIWAEYMMVASNLVFNDYGTVSLQSAQFIITQAATGFATNQATLNGTLSRTGTSDTVVSVFWEQDGDQGTNTTDWANTNDFGAYSPALGELPYNYATNITGLFAGTTYTYRYYATNDAGEAWGGAVSFTTLEAPGVPTIDAPSETGFVHVVISGEVNGGNPDPLAYFCLNADSDSGTGGTSGWDIVESAGTQSGSFTNTIMDLSDDTTYYARVYVTNEAGEAWSSVINFTTETTPAQLTLDQDRQIDGDSPFLSFEETPASLSGSGTKPNWLYDFSYYGTNSIPVDLSSNTLYSADSAERGTITLDMNGADLSGTGEVAVVTRSANNASADHLTITNVGTVNMGGIDTHTIGSGSSTYAYAGNVKLYSTGSVRTDSILTGSVNNNNRGGPGNVTVIAAGNVFIESADGSVPGLIDASPWTRQPGTIYVKHAGHFRSAGLRNYVEDSWSGGNIPLSDITIDGTDSSGDFVTGDIDSGYRSPHNGGGTRKTITIRNYNDVSTGVISSRYSGTGGYANNVNISENITGDISIAGKVDLYHSSSARKGSLTLACDGTITLAELDLDEVLQASLSSGNSTSLITGTLTNFNAGYTSGSGTDSDPYVTTQTVLRCSSDQKIYYNYTAGDLNSELGGYTYQVAAPDGTDGTGGILKVRPAAGTVMLIR